MTPHLRLSVSEIPFRWIDWNNQEDVALHDSVSHEFSRGVEADDFEGALTNIKDLFASTTLRPII